MYICVFCKTEFKNPQGLVSHLNHPESKCKSNIKEYYDKYLKKPNDGVCHVCGIETTFKSLAKGYCNSLCKECNNSNKDIEKNKKRSKSIKKTLKKKKELKLARTKLIQLLRIRTIDRKNKLQCQICGIPFSNYKSIAKHLRIHKIKLKDYYNLYFKSTNENICLCYKEVDTCKKYTKFKSLEEGYVNYCSTRCVSLSIITYEEKEKKCLKNRGVSHPTKDPEINKLQIEGIHKVWKNKKDVILEKRRKTHKKTFIPKIKEFLKAINVELINYNGCQSISIFKCLLCNKEYKGVWDYLLHSGSRCPSCFSNSKPEKEIQGYVRSIVPENVEILLNYRGLIKNPITKHPLELDIYIPSKNIALEFNGLYWHSELILNNPEKYHLVKYEECRKKGVQLIQIFEDEWLTKRKVIESMIKHKLKLNNSQKIFARKCIIKEIDPKTKNEFLELTHIQGKDYTKLKLGAFYNNELVAVMTFNHGNITRGGNPNDKLTWELSRFATKYQVVGIAGKLLEHFKRNYQWKEIYSYADLRISDGNMYYNLGFNLKHQTLPDYFYIGNGIKRIHRFNLRKRLDEPKDIPEWQLRHDEGYFRIWDCGKLKFELQNHNI